jgi:hypothetical protein
VVVVVMVAVTVVGGVVAEVVKTAVNKCLKAKWDAYVGVL